MWIRLSLFILLSLVHYTIFVSGLCHMNITPLHYTTHANIKQTHINTPTRIIPGRGCAAKHRHYEHESARYPTGYPSTCHTAEPNAGAASASAAADAGTANSQHVEPGKRQELAPFASHIINMIHYLNFIRFCFACILFVIVFNFWMTKRLYLRSNRICSNKPMAHSSISLTIITSSGPCSKILVHRHIFRRHSMRLSAPTAPVLLVVILTSNSSSSNSIIHTSTSNPCRCRQCSM